jgi:hypothetical protein
MDLATSWAIFSQTRLVTLFAVETHFEDFFFYLWHFQGSFFESDEKPIWLPLMPFPA